MQTFFLTRYSFFGKSDWRSKASNDPELLLNPARLEQRETLFERIALQSLSDQTDPDFKLLVLSSEAMPEAYKKRLLALCNDMLGERAHVLFRKPQRTAGCFNQYRAQQLPRKSKYVIQSILDDDDGVSSDFVSRIKREARVAERSFEKKDDYTFISHATGVNLKISEDGSAEVTHRSMPCTTQGLTLVSRSNSNRSPFNIAHKKILERRPVRVCHGGPVMYVRTGHNLNDSRTILSDHRPVTQEAVSDIIQNRLPLLAQFTPQALRIAA